MATDRFLICDFAGSCATVEFLKGRLVYHAKDRFPVRALTNSTYSEAVSCWENGQIPEIDRRQSIGRFIRAAGMMEKYDSKTKSPVDYTFMILSSVANPSDTQWSIVYDIGNFCIYFRKKRKPKSPQFLFKII